MENALIFSTSIVYVSKWDLLQFFSISITYEPNHEKLPLCHRLGEVFFSTGNLMLSQTLWCRGLFNILTAFILIGQGMSKSFWDADKHTFCDTFGHPKGCPTINKSQVLTCVALWKCQYASGENLLLSQENWFADEENHKSVFCKNLAFMTLENPGRILAVNCIRLTYKRFKIDTKRLLKCRFV